MDDPAPRLFVAVPHPDTAALVRCALAEAEIELVDKPAALADGCHAALLAAGGKGDASADALRTCPATRQAPIIALMPRRMLESQGPPAWADDVLASPFDLDELLLRVQNAVSLGRALLRHRRGAWRKASQPAATASEAPETYGGSDLVGRVIAGCRIERKLTASRRPVFLAEHLALGIRVCIKLIPAAVEEWSPAEVDRFLRGARVAAQVEHPNVVPVLNAGGEGAFHYVVRRYVEGQSLADRLAASGAMAVGEAVPIACRAAEGLGAAHALQLVHRDVKPANIILTPDGGAKLIDFGLARPLEPGGVSSTGEVIGTPHYMSPEQCDGDVLDPRADIYSLGATLYHMLCGRPPFEADSLLGLIRKQVADDPAPPSERAAIPGPLSDVVMRMMAKARDRRYASMEEVVSALVESST